MLIDEKAWCLSHDTVAMKDQKHCICRPANHSPKDNTELNAQIADKTLFLCCIELVKGLLDISILVRVAILEIGQLLKLMIDSHDVASCLECFNGSFETINCLSVWIFHLMHCNSFHQSFVGVLQLEQHTVCLDGCNAKL